MKNGGAFYCVEYLLVFTVDIADWIASGILFSHTWLWWCVFFETGYFWEFNGDNGYYIMMLYSTDVYSGWFWDLMVTMDII